jgi:hypothetical protein
VEKALWDETKSFLQSKVASVASERGKTPVHWIFLSPTRHGRRRQTTSPGAKPLLQLTFIRCVSQSTSKDDIFRSGQSLEVSSLHAVITMLFHASLNIHYHFYFLIGLTKQLPTFKITYMIFLISFPYLSVYFSIVGSFIAHLIPSLHLSPSHAFLSPLCQFFFVWPSPFLLSSVHHLFS